MKKKLSFLLCMICLLSVINFQVIDIPAFANNSGNKLEGLSPVNLGDTFSAYIRHPATGLYITNDNSNAYATSGIFDQSQIWQFKRQSNGAYIIGNSSTGKVLDIPGANFTDGTNVQMYSSNGSEAQQFYIYHSAGLFFFKSLGNKTLDLDVGTKNLQIYGCETGVSTRDEAPLVFNARSFEILKLQLDSSNFNSNFGHTFEAYIRNTASGKLLTAEGDNAIFRSPSYNDGQKWTITRNEYGGHEIKSVQNGKVLDVYGVSIADGASVKLWSHNNSVAQRFFFINAGGSMVYIKPAYTNTVLEMDSSTSEVLSCSHDTTTAGKDAQIFEIIADRHIASDDKVTESVYLGNKLTATIKHSSSDKVFTDGENGLSMSQYTGSEQQIWTFEYDAVWNAYTIIGSSGKVLDVQGGAYENSARLDLWSSNDTVAQRFRFYESGDGYMISPVYTNKIVDLKAEDGSTLQLYGSTPATNRLFSLTILSLNGQKPVDFGETFQSTITNKATGLYITGNSDGEVSCSSTKQRWTFTRNSDGSYTIENNDYGKVLDIPGSSVHPGTHVQLYTSNGSLAQRFFIFETKGGFVLRCGNNVNVLEVDSSTKKVNIYGEKVNTEQLFLFEVLSLKSNSDYSKDEEYVTKVPPKSTANDILSQFHNTNIEIYNKNGNKVEGATVCGTGSSLNLITDGIVTNSLSVVITGDVDGNGIIDGTDYIQIKGAFLETTHLTNAYFIAADTDKNKTIDSTDYLSVKKSFLDGVSLDKNDALPEEIADKDFTELPKDTNIDNSPAEILNYLKAQSYLLEYSSTGNNVTRLEFASNIVLHSGFYTNFAHYYPKGDYADISRFTNDAKFAEIAVNQGYMVKPTGNFNPDTPVTYEEVLRGYLYVLGYREYADQKGYIALANETGLTDNISTDKQLSSSVTWGEYSQILYNAFHLPLVQTIEKDGEYYPVAKTGLYIPDTYIKRTEKASKTSAIFSLPNTGWNVFNGSWGYKYGPSIIINDDGSIDMWTASHSGISGEVDYGVYRASYDGGRTWTAEQNALQPTPASEDWNWTCDPGVVKFGDYYYGFYTSTSWHDGIDNNLFVSRSKTPEGPFMEKWDGDSWGTVAKPIVTYDGTKTSWGAGEGCGVVVGDTLYIYATWTANNGNFTMCYTAPANDENWPSKIKYEGIAFNRENAEDSSDVKYIDAYNQFISVSTASRFEETCYINIRTSFDGKYFRNEAVIKHQDEGSNLVTSIHNMGISGDASGHIDIFRQNYVGFAYNPETAIWGNWPTRFVPVVWYGTNLYDDPSSVIQFSDGTDTDSRSSATVGGVRVLNSSNNRSFRATSISEKMFFYVQYMDEYGNWNGISSSEYSNVVFHYDASKVKIDIANQTISLLVNEIITIKVSYKGNEGFFTLIPDFADKSKPESLYAEVSVLTFTKAGETKQPAFIARSYSGDYLSLWGNLSSYTDSNTKDQPEYITKWNQKVSLSGWDSSIISVDTTTGKITAKAIGTTTVTATFMGLTAKLTVVVETV